MDDEGALPVMTERPQTLSKSTRNRFSCAAVAVAGLALFAASPVMAQEVVQEAAESEPFDDLGAQSGAIVVTGRRLGDDLFEAVPIPENTCLASAPALGNAEPAFAIDASRMRKISDLEKVRKRTRDGVIFVKGGSFVGARLDGARLQDMCFFGTDFSQSDWRKFSGRGMGFVSVNLSNAQMAGAQMPYILLRDANLSDVNANGANFRFGRLDGGWAGSLRNLVLEKADLTSFKIVCGSTQQDGCPADRTGLSLKGANLRRASLYSFLLPEIDLTETIIDQTELGMDHLARIDGARLIGPVIVRSDRRAMMLFPVEARGLGKASTAAIPVDRRCDAPQTPADRAVCAVPGSEMRALAREIVSLEAKVSGQPEFARTRVQFESERNACLAKAEDLRASCLLAVYGARSRALRAAAGAPDWVREPGYRLYMSSEAAIGRGGTAPIYGRILPILLDSANSILLIKVQPRGRIDAKGFGEGGCRLSATNLRYDSATGSLVISARRGSGPPLITLSGGEAQVQREALAASGGGCGPTGSFARMREIELDETLLSELYLSF